MQCLSFPGVEGDAVVGNTLSISPGGWTESPSALHYTWLSDGSPIPGAVSATYDIASDDVGHSISCRVQAVGAGGVALTVTTTALTAKVG
jgi:hypothetical protein